MPNLHGLTFEKPTGKPLSDWLLLPSIFGVPDPVGDGSVDGGTPQEVRGMGIPMLDEHIRYLNREYPA